MGSKIQIEGYLFVPYRGQYRFGAEFDPDTKNLEFSTSRKIHDHHWCKNMRQRPSLQEFNSTDKLVGKVRRDYQASIKQSVGHCAEILKSTMEHKLTWAIGNESDGIYVQFLSVRNAYGEAK